MHADIWRWSAVETAAAIRRRQFSCVEAVQAAVERMWAVNAVTSGVPSCRSAGD